jgi:hypothetical protein
MAHHEWLHLLRGLIVAAGLAIILVTLGFVSRPAGVVSPGVVSPGSPPIILIAR